MRKRLASLTATPHGRKLAYHLFFAALLLAVLQAVFVLLHVEAAAKGVEVILVAFAEHFLFGIDS